MNTLAFPSLEGLTDEQKLAIRELCKRQEGRLFFGVSIGTCIADFKRANVLRETNPEKAQTNETALFALCGHIPQ